MNRAISHQKRKENDYFVIVDNKNGARLKCQNGYLYGSFHTYDEAKKTWTKANNLSAIICHEEVYTYFDENGNFIRREIYTSIV